MNIFSLSITILVVVSFATSATIANGQNRAPAASWQQYPEGISSLLTLTSKEMSGNKETKLTLFVKNTSGGVKSITIGSDGSGVSFFVQDDKNEWHPLRRYVFKGPISAKDEIIIPGAKGSYSIDLSPPELALVETHPIQCSFALQDWSLKRTFPIQSSPQQLSEAVEK